MRTSFFQRLHNGDAINALIDQPEDAHFDCKEWPAKDDDAHRMLAKAACGLANAEGGVLVIGLKAESRSKDEPDVVSSTVPVQNTSLVKSKVLNLIGNLIEPGIVGILAVEVNDPNTSKSGFVVVYIPATEGSPLRSRKDWKFYQRIGSGTFPMEYFQIEAMFGKKPNPKLELYLESEGIGTSTGNPMFLVRRLTLGLRNAGNGIAKFPGVRFASSFGLSVDQLGIDGHGGSGIPKRPSDYKWIIFRGGVDDVIYPGEIRKITTLLQNGENRKTEGIPFGIVFTHDGNVVKNLWVFKSIDFSCQISCESAATQIAGRSISEDSLLQDIF